MSQYLVPKVVFSFNERSDTVDAIRDFCTRGLLIPGEFLETYARATDMDAFYVHTKNGLRFMISGPEVAQWEYRRGIKKACAPSRDSEFDDKR